MTQSTVPSVQSRPRRQCRICGAALKRNPGKLVCPPCYATAGQHPAPWWDAGHAIKTNEQATAA